MLGFLERMDAINRPETDKWYRGQVKHFTERIEQLLLITPKGQEGQARVFRERLSRCRRFD